MNSFLCMEIRNVRFDFKSIDKYILDESFTIIGGNVYKTRHLLTLKNTFFNSHPPTFASHTHNFPPNYLHQSLKHERKEPIYN